MCYLYQHYKKDFGFLRASKRACVGTSLFASASVVCVFTLMRRSVMCKNHFDILKGVVKLRGQIWSNKRLSAPLLFNGLKYMYMDFHITWHKN